MSGIVGHSGLLLGPKVAEAVSLYAAMRSWWPMDDNAASSQYTDVHGGHHLTARTGASTIDTSTVSSATAKQGRAFNCANTDNRTAYVPRSDTALDMPNSDFSFGGWFRISMPSAVTAAFVIGRVGDNNTTAIQAQIYVESDGSLRASASTDGTASGRIHANLGTGMHSSSEYQLIVLTFNRTANQIEARYRRQGYSSGTLQTAATAFPSALFTSPNDSNFTISEGLRSDTNFFASNRSAVVFADECFYCDKAMTDAEFNYLYNGGAGIDYAKLVAEGA